MPVDYKRIVGPEGAVSPVNFYEKPKSNFLVNKNGLRKDGRSPKDPRPMFVDVGAVSQAKGSAYVELGNTKVLSAVYGPREVPKKQDFSINGQLRCEFKFAPFSCARRRQHQQDEEEKALSNLLKETLEPVVCLDKFPKAQVDVFVTILENDGSVLAAAITASGTALADAGIQCYDLLAGCTQGFFNDHVLVDLTSAEEEFIMNEDCNGHFGIVTLGLMPSLNQIAAFLQEGALSHNSLIVHGIKSLSSLCIGVTQNVQKALTEGLEKKAKKEG